ncbi:Replication protein A 70 kDa DNA-binding subunit B, partial [Ananas comosus]
MIRNALILNEVSTMINTDQRSLCSPPEPLGQTRIARKARTTQKYIKTGLKACRLLHPPRTTLGDLNIMDRHLPCATAAWPFPLSALAVFIFNRKLALKKNMFFYAASFEPSFSSHGPSLSAAAHSSLENYCGMDFILLKQLSLAQQHCKIRARISRIWESTTPLNKNNILSLDCLLIDDEEYTMQATVRKYDAEHFRSLLSEGTVYIFENFNVVPSRNNYKVVDRKYMVQISKWTRVLKTKDDISSFPLYSFYFISFGHVKAKKHNEGCLLDVLGGVTSIAPVSHTYVAQDLTAVRKLEIRDIDDQVLSVTLRDKFALDFDDELLKRKEIDGLVAIVLASMTVRTYRDNVYLSTCSASRLYLNLEIPEVLQFESNLRSKQTSVVPILHIESDDKPLLSPLEQTVQNRKTIAELISPNLPEEQGAGYTCKANLLTIDTTYGWWYKACYDCKGAVKDYGDAFWCDETGSANFISFGKVAQDLVHIPAQQLAIATNLDRFVLPPVVKNIIGRSYNFQILPDNRWSSMNLKSFRVTKMFSTDLESKGKEKECANRVQDIEEEIVGSTIVVNQICDIVEEISLNQLPQSISQSSLETFVLRILDQMMKKNEVIG